MEMLRRFYLLILLNFDGWVVIKLAEKCDLGKTYIKPRLHIVT
jgi:hypothetical protein